MITKFKNDGTSKILITSSHVIIINGDEILVNDYSRSYKPVSISMADGKPVFEEPAPGVNNIPWGITSLNNPIPTQSQSPTEPVTWNPEQGLNEMI